VADVGDGARVYEILSRLLNEENNIARACTPFQQSVRSEIFPPDALFTADGWNSHRVILPMALRSSADVPVPADRVVTASVHLGINNSDALASRISIESCRPQDSGSNKEQISDARFGKLR
jgi:hypothetical protein